MTKLVTFLGRKPVSAAVKPSIAPQPVSAPPDKDEIELDQDLFFPIASQLGQENETVRNLLLDAEHKIGELETIKRSIGKLVDPVTKTLRAYEESKSEKLSLQGVLNTTRVAYNKLRDELGVTQKKAATFEAECVQLKDVVSVAQQSVAALERTKAEQLTELAARRAHIAELQRHCQQQGSDLELTRGENRRMAERIASADKRTVQLEGQVQAAQQRAMQADQERASVQASLDKTLGELAQTARRLNESERALASTQSRLQLVEHSLAETQAERSRLSAALDEANHKHLDEMNMQNSRFDSLQARASMTETLLAEARQTLMARADEIRTFERRVVETATARDNSTDKLSQVIEVLAEREARIRDLEATHTALSEQNQMLTHAMAARDASHYQAQERLREQTSLAQLLEDQLHAARVSNEMQIEQLNAQLQREQLERSMAEGALEAGRRDVSRLLRELGEVQYRPLPASAAEMTTPTNLRSAA